MKCTDDSCDQVHCRRCGCHAAGNALTMRMCQDCYNLEEEEYHKWMREEWEANNPISPQDSFKEEVFEWVEERIRRFKVEKLATEGEASLMDEMGEKYTKHVEVAVNFGRIEGTLDILVALERFLKRR